MKEMSRRLVGSGKDPLPSFIENREIRNAGRNEGWWGPLPPEEQGAGLQRCYLLL